jgi:membrane-bound serine protease (ClpP class)
LAQPEAHVVVARIDGIIDPFVGQYVESVIQRAGEDGAELLILELDTPGGADGPMRRIVTQLLNAPLPTVVYVSPAGARAGSAGVFIAMAAHIAAMSPGTNIGAAHPVGLGGTSFSPELDAKITNDAAAYIRTIAEERGRNADWAERSVRKSVSITAREALEVGVIDLVADDLDLLLTSLDGREVAVNGGVTLHTLGIEARRLSMSLPARFLHQMVNPNIAYLLLIIGFVALIAEFYNPGTLLPALTGIICLILALVGLGNLPVNWGGVVLILVALVLFVLDIKVAGFALSVGGAIAFVLGSLLLFTPLTPGPPSIPSLAVSRWLIALMTALISSFFIFALAAGIRAQRARVQVGSEVLVGQTGVAITDLVPMGQVHVGGEVWSATASGDHIEKGEGIAVMEVEGLRLKVRAKEN